MYVWMYACIHIPAHAPPRPFRGGMDGFPNSFFPLCACFHVEWSQIVYYLTHIIHHLFTNIMHTCWSTLDSRQHPKNFKPSVHGISFSSIPYTHSLCLHVSKTVIIAGFDRTDNTKCVNRYIRIYVHTYTYKHTYVYIHKFTNFITRCIYFQVMKAKLNFVDQANKCLDDGCSLDDVDLLLVELRQTVRYVVECISLFQHFLLLHW